MDVDNNLFGLEAPRTLALELFKPVCDHDRGIITDIDLQESVMSVVENFIATARHLVQDLAILLIRSSMFPSFVIMITR